MPDQVRIALGIEYKGTQYHGWQRQVSLPTVQAVLEQALTQVANHPIKLICAGRTDAGVHALEQVVHFNTHADRPMGAWEKGPNTLLPNDICVRWAKQVGMDFSARFSATARHYVYKIDNRPQSPAISDKLITWHPYPLDEKKMHQAAQSLIGEHDFSSFRSSRCQSKTAIRNVHWIRVTREGSLIEVDIQANAFLHHMVRNIVGVLLKIGEGKAQVRWAEDVLKERDRKVGAATAHPQGLYLTQVLY